MQTSTCAGTIPVQAPSQIGPPFHTMPFAVLIDYGDLGMIFNVTGPKPWLDDSEGPIPNSLPLALEAPGAAHLDVIQAGPECIGCRDPSFAGSWLQSNAVQHHSAN